MGVFCVGSWKLYTSVIFELRKFLLLNFERSFIPILVLVQFQRFNLIRLLVIFKTWGLDTQVRFVEFVWFKGCGVVAVTALEYLKTIRFTKLNMCEPHDIVFSYKIWVMTAHFLLNILLMSLFIHSLILTLVFIFNLLLVIQDTVLIYEILLKLTYKFTANLFCTKHLLQFIVF